MQNQGTDSPSREATFSVRNLTMADAASALVVLLDVAPLIPIRNLSPEAVAALRAAIEGPFCNPYSVIATAQNGDVAGFQFAKLAEDFESPGEPPCIKLVYTGVAAPYRCKGVFRCLVKTIMQHRLPLFAEVLPDNQSNMATILPRLGFVAGTHLIGPVFWWRP